MWAISIRNPNYESAKEKMPVKVDSTMCCSPTPFDCDLLSELEQELELVNDVTNYDDIWSNFIPTPPQSPQMNLDFMDFSLDNLLEETKPETDQKLIHHDCMWSGQCSEGKCNSLYNKSLNKPWVRPETPFNLSTSPINTFSDVSPYDITSISEPLNTFLEEDAHEQPSVEGNVFAMANDHSYESSTSNTIKIKTEVVENSYNESSLIKKPIIPKIINQGKITKIKCKKVGHKKSENSILNTSITRLPKNETSVLKPTIISVSNFKNLQDHTKYNMAIKKKNFNFVDVKNNSISRQMIQIKKVPTINNICMPLNSPSSSDSEESTLSFSSGEDRCKASPPFRRREHNDSERKRRDHLRNSFNNLKDQIPKLKSAEKRPPRIMILHEATTYVTQLIDTNFSLEQTLEAEREKKKRLMKLLNSLNSNKDAC